MRGESILIVDDEKLIRWSLSNEMTSAGFSVFEADTVKSALDIIKEKEPDVILLDQHLPDGFGMEVLEMIRENNLGIPVIMLTVIDTSDTAVQAMKLGAFDYLTKPVNTEELLVLVEKALETTMLKRRVNRLLKEQTDRMGFQHIIGSSRAMRNVMDTIVKVAKSETTTVLITGESGTGKELVARSIHELSLRGQETFVAVNCSALTDTLVESELFGHEKGAFTDARHQRKGIFELANGGTVFLDEIGDISLAAQAKLLRILEERSFRRIGGSVDINVDIRIIAATNQSLEQLIADGKFRKDLYYRLNVAAINLPPVRERGEDVLLLAEFFLNQFNAKFHRSFKGLSEETKQLFLQYDWPGNVREIRNVIERAVLLDDGEYLEAKYIELGHLRTSGDNDSAQKVSKTNNMSLNELEKRALLDALEKSGHNQSQAARLLGISRDTLRYRMKKHGISRKK